MSTTRHPTRDQQTQHSCWGWPGKLPMCQLVLVDPLHPLPAQLPLSMARPLPGPLTLTSQLARPPFPQRCSLRVCRERDRLQQQHQDTWLYRSSPGAHGTHQVFELC